MVDPNVDSPRPSAENFLIYIEKKIGCAPGRGRSKGGFSAPERIKLSLSIKKRKSVPRSGAVDPKVDSPRPSAENFLPYKSFPRSDAVDPNVDSPRPSAENPGAVDPKVDSPRLSAENFLPYIEKKIVSALGRGRSKCGFSAPERRKSGRGKSKGGFSAPERRKFSPLYREENHFRARAR